MCSYTLPDFPVFEPLSFHQREVINAYTSRYAPYTEYSFTTMWCWDLRQIAALSSLNGNLVIRSGEYATGLPYLSFLGEVRRRETALTLLAHSELALARSHLCFVPEISVAGSVEEFTGWLDIQEDRSNFDYVLDLEALAVFAGPAFRGKRQAAAHFYRACSPKVRLLDLGEKKDQTLILSAFDTWAESRRKDENDVADELWALRRVFDVWNGRTLTCVGVFLDERLTSFSVAEIHNNGFAVGLFSKADARIRGAFEFLRQAQAHCLRGLGCKWLSIQQDMGVPGLRQAKLSYRPVQFLRKYTIYRPAHSG